MKHRQNPGLTAMHHGSARSHTFASEQEVSEQESINNDPHISADAVSLPEESQVDFPLMLNLAANTTSE